MAKGVSHTFEGRLARANARGTVGSGRSEEEIRRERTALEEEGRRRAAPNGAFPKDVIKRIDKLIKELDTNQQAARQAASRMDDALAAADAMFERADALSRADADKTPTLKQVQAAEDRYHALGLRIERAKASAGYRRGGTTGDLQAKKGAAFSEFYRLKAAFEAAGGTYVKS